MATDIVGLDEILGDGMAEVLGPEVARPPQSPGVSFKQREPHLGTGLVLGLCFAGVHFISGTFLFSHFPIQFLLLLVS